MLSVWIVQFLSFPHYVHLLYFEDKAVIGQQMLAIKAHKLSILLTSGVARRRKVGEHKLFSRKVKSKKKKKKKKRSQRRLSAWQGIANRGRVFII